MPEYNKELAYQQGVSLIITVPGETGKLEQLVQSFLINNSHHPVEMIIVDHSATPDPEKMIIKYNACAFFMHIQADPGYAYALSNNYAAGKAIYPNLLFLKHDFFFTSDILPEAVKKLKASSLDPSLSLNKQFFSLEQDSQDGPGGASLFCQRADFEAAGGFDENGDDCMAKHFSRLSDRSSGPVNSMSPGVGLQMNDLISTFKPFNPDRPVVSLHVPKTAGTAFRTVLKSWYKDHLLMHYPDISLQEADNFADLRPGQCLHGHFNRGKGFAIEDFAGKNPHDQANIITMLRNPYKMIVSLFLYYKYQAPDAVIEKSILTDQRPQSFKNFFNRFLDSKHYLFSYLLRTAPLSAENIDHYLGQYTFIGLQEELEKSVVLLARLLGKKPLKPLQKNISDYSKDDIPDLEGLAREVFVDEYRLYDRVKNILNG